MIAAGVLVAIGLYVAVDAIWTTDTERVELEVERLIDLAREGGPGAAEEILAALADDYDGASPFTRESIARNLEAYVATSRVRNLKSGSYTAVWKGDDILVPLLVLEADAGDRSGTLYLTIVFGQRDGRWKVVDISRAWSR